MAQHRTPTRLDSASDDLGQALQQFESLTKEIERLSINTPKGLERGKALLDKFEECGQKVAGGMQDLAQALDELREQTEKSAQLVYTKAVAIKQRQVEMDQLLERFRMLGEMARNFNSTMLRLDQHDGALNPAQLKESFSHRMPEIDGHLEILIDEARKIKNDAHDASMKNLEGEADAIRQGLQSARNRLKSFEIMRQTGLT